MLCRVAAWTVTAVLVVWPVRSGYDAGTLDEFATVSIAPVPAHELAADQLPNQPEHQGDNPVVALVTPPAIDAEAQDRSAFRGEAATQLATLEPAEPAYRRSPAPVEQPFGLTSTPVNSGDVVTKWNGVEARIRADNEILARCRDDAKNCPKAAQNFLAIVAQGRALSGRARIGAINRAVNLSIEPMSDMAQWGVPDRWSPPLETFTTGKGDCEDYAIAKYVALTAAGIDADDVKLIIVRNIEANEDHAVTTVRIDGDWIVLDNRWLTLVADVDMPKVVPLFVLDDQGVKRFAPPALIGARQGATPASVAY
jgi:predicted transglutaminase-like cysteine proteinase